MDEDVIIVGTMDQCTQNNNAIGRGSAKWSDDAHLMFIELCEEEIRKGNRPNSCLSKDGWKNIMGEFNKRTGKKYDKKQLKNHWDHMKAEWTLFRQLMNGETGLGWDDTRKTVIADDEWWERKIKENPKFRKFKNKNLSLIWFRYDGLFSDIVATGERALAPCQIPMEDVGLEIEDEGINIIIDDADSSDGDYNLEKTDVINAFEPSVKRQKVRHGNNNQVRKAKSKSGATAMTENIEKLLELMATKISTSSSYHPQELVAPSLEKCMDIIEKMPGITPMGDLWNFASMALGKKDMRYIFLRQPSDEARLSWLEFCYKHSCGK